MSDPISKTFEALRQKGDVQLVYLSASEGEPAHYRATIHYWPGSGEQQTVKADGPNIAGVLEDLLHAYDQTHVEVVTP
jgi:hypothetical protein